jgi:hypothetical protein
LSWYSSSGSVSTTRSTSQSTGLSSGDAWCVGPAGKRLAAQNFASNRLSSYVHILQLNTTLSIFHRLRVGTVVASTHMWREMVQTRYREKTFFIVREYTPKSTRPDASQVTVYAIGADIMTAFHVGFS